MVAEFQKSRLSTGGRRAKAVSQKLMLEQQMAEKARARERERHERDDEICKTKDRAPLVPLARARAGATCREEEKKRRRKKKEKTGRERAQLNLDPADVEFVRPTLKIP